MNFGNSTSCFSLKGENDWWDRVACDRIFVFKLISSPGYPMHFGDGTSCFSLKGENNWGDKGTCDRVFVFPSNNPVNPMHFGGGTSAFSMKGENDWWDMTRRRTGQTVKTVR